MRCLCVWVLLGFIGSAVGARAQTPEDRYLRAYALIEQAERLNSGGDTRGAVNRYLEAQVALKELQQNYPTWNTRILTFRLEYISAQLEPLTKGGLPPAQPDSSETRKANPLEQQQAEITRLAGQNALLEARLREALKVQPASSDPRELARAEERIKALQKERDLLAVTLEQSRIGLVAGSTAAAQAVPEQPQVVTPFAVPDVLKMQNEELQRRIVELHAQLQRDTAARASETLPLKETIAALQASNRVMKAEQVSMENRLVEFVKTFHLGASEREKDYEKKLAEARVAAETAQKERDTLIQRLDTVTRELTKPADKPAIAASAELEPQFQAIRARLEILEAQAVPYSTEELALFKQAPIKIAADQAAAPPPAKAPTNATTSTVAARKKDLPAGAGPLLRDADRAIDSGRFDEAERKLRDVLRQDEDQPYVLAKLAAVQMDQDKMADAEASLKKALAVDPQDAACLYLMGSLKVRQEKFDEGIDLLSQTVKLAPENAQAHYFLAKALVQKGQRKPAETALRKAIHLKPGWGDAHYLLAVIYATQEPNFKGLAQYHYKRAIAGGAPRNPDLERWMEKTVPAGK